MGVESTRPTGDQRVESQLWEQHWHLLCHRSEVPGTSFFVRLDILGQEVVAYHDGNDVVVFDNRCPHRGTRIFDDNSGKQRFLCRYHGWSYAKGRLFIPFKESFQESDPQQARLNTYKVDWLGDFLFISLRPKQSLSDQLRGVEDVVQSISRSIAARADFNAYPYRCNWKIAVENALDQYHVSIIHHDTLNRLKLEPARDEYFGTNNISYARVGDDRVYRRLKSLRRLFDIEYCVEDYVAVFMFPFTFLTSTFGYSYSLQQFYPSRDLEQTHFNSRFYSGRLSNKISPDAMQSFFESSIAMNHRVFAEDGEICSRVPADTWTPEPPQFLSRGEDKIVHFRDSMSRFFSSNIPPASIPRAPGAGLPT